jgi:hypothetical protein
MPAQRHHAFTRRKLKMASGVRASAVAKNTALLSDFRAGAALGTEQVRSPFLSRCGFIRYSADRLSAMRLPPFDKAQGSFAQEGQNINRGQSHTDRCSQQQPARAQPKVVAGIPMRSTLCPKLKT